MAGLEGTLIVLMLPWEHTFHNIYEKWQCPLSTSLTWRPFGKGILSNIFLLLLVFWVFKTVDYMLKSHLSYEQRSVSSYLLIFVYAPISNRTLIHLADIIKRVIWKQSLLMWNLVQWYESVPNDVRRTHVLKLF